MNILKLELGLKGMMASVAECVIQPPYSALNAVRAIQEQVSKMPRAASPITVPPPTVAKPMSRYLFSFFLLSFFFLDASAVLWGDEKHKN